MATKTTIGTTASVMVEMRGTVVASSATAKVIRVETGFSRLYVVTRGSMTAIVEREEDARMLAGI